MKFFPSLTVLILAATAGIPPKTFAQTEGDTALRIARLAIEVDRTVSLRAVKDLQYTYSQHAQAGQWKQMAALFAKDAELIYGAETVRGRAAIAQFFLDRFGGGREGMPPGAVHAKLIERPVVNLSADGATAQGRWLEFSMDGVPGRQASWSGGIQTNEYVRENGVWKFARLRYHPQFAGSYGEGWKALEQDIAVVPYHF